MDILLNRTHIRLPFSRGAGLFVSPPPPLLVQPQAHRGADFQPLVGSISGVRSAHLDAYVDWPATAQAGFAPWPGQPSLLAAQSSPAT